MNCVAAHRAIARGGEAHAQSRRGRGAEIEIRVAKRLVRQSIESDRLIRLGNAESLRHVGRRIEIRIARL